MQLLGREHPTRGHILERLQRCAALRLGLRLVVDRGAQKLSGERIPPVEAQLLQSLRRRVGGLALGELVDQLV